MSTAARLQLLLAVPGFDELPTLELATLAAAVDELDVAEGEVLMRDGLPPAQSFVIAAGSAVVYSQGRTAAIVGPGTFIGRLPGECGPHAATVVAVRAMTLLVMSPAMLQRLVASRPPGNGVEDVHVGGVDSQTQPPARRDVRASIERRGAPRAPDDEVHEDLGA